MTTIREIWGTNQIIRPVLVPREKAPPPPSVMKELDMVSEADAIRKSYRHVRKLHAFAKPHWTTLPPDVKAALTDFILLWNLAKQRKRSETMQFLKQGKVCVWFNSSEEGRQLWERYVSESELVAAFSAIEDHIQKDSQVLYMRRIKPSAGGQEKHEA